MGEAGLGTGEDLGIAAGWDPRRPGAVAGAGASVFSPVLAAEIVTAVAAGASLRGFCSQPGRPHRTTVRNWRKAHPDFGAALGAAYMLARSAERRQDRAAELERRAALAANAAPRGGKPSTYTPEIGEAVCARIEAGESLTSIGRDPAMPSYGAVLKWVKQFPAFEERYVAARRVQGDFLFDEARDVALAATKEEVPVARLRFDVIRWQAAKLAPRKYLESLVAAAGKAEIAEAADDGGEPHQITFFAMHFEAGPNGEVLAAPPRNADEAEAWVRATGRAYEAGVGPNGEVRPPAQTPEEWAERDALMARMAARRNRRGR